MRDMDSKEEEAFLKGFLTGVLAMALVAVVCGLIVFAGRYFDF